MAKLRLSSLFAPPGILPSFRFRLALNPKHSTGKYHRAAGEYGLPHPKTEEEFGVGGAGEGGGRGGGGGAGEGGERGGAGSRALNRKP